MRWREALSRPLKRPKSMCRWSCDWPGPTPPKVCRSSRTPKSRTCRARRHWSRPPGKRSWPRRERRTDMAILIDKNTRVLVQGITGHDGLFQTQQMIGYGTNVVGGVTPGKGGEWVEGKPVFDTVKEGRESTGANATC